MDEHVLAAVVAGDEAEALGVVEPLDLAAADRDRGRRIGRRAARRDAAPSPNERCGDARPTPAVSTSTTRVTCAPLAPAPTMTLQLGARRHGLVPRGVQRVGVQKGVALAVRQFDEAVALVGLEPFDDGVDRRPGRRGADGAALDAPPAVRRSRRPDRRQSRARRAGAARRASARRRRIRACVAPGNLYPCSC